jgi:hypothetical protein
MCISVHVFVGWSECDKQPQAAQIKGPRCQFVNEWLPPIKPRTYMDSFAKEHSLGLLMLAFIATILIGLAIGTLVGLLTPNLVTRRALKVAFVLLSLPFFMQFCWALFALTTVHGTNIRPTDVPGFSIPIESTGISYLRRYSRTYFVLEFTLSRDTFFEWMKNEGRDVTPISEPEFTLGLDQRDTKKIVEVTIQRGFRWDDYDDSGFDDSGTTVMFDADINHVYVVCTLW